MLHKNFRNENAVSESPVGLIVFFGISLAISSILISWFTLQMFGAAAVSPIVLPHFSIDNSRVNYFADNDTENIIMQGGIWNYIVGGYESSTADSFLLFDNVAYSTGTTYINEYTITEDEPYAIELIYIDNNNYLEIITKADGYYTHLVQKVCIPATGICENVGSELHPDTFYPNPSALSIANPVLIRTEYNPVATLDTDECFEYYVNDNLMFTATEQELFNGINLYPVKKYYAGVHSLSAGTLVSNFVNVVNNPETNAILEVLARSLEFVATVLQLIVFNIPSEYFPLELNFILIKTQVFAFGWGILGWIRGNV